MADRHATRPRGFREGSSGPTTPDQRNRTSYNAGESSSNGGRGPVGATAYDSTPNVTDDSLEPRTSPADATLHNGATKDDKTRRRRSDRPKGGFLLQDAVPVRRAKSSRIPRRRPSPSAAEPIRRSEDRNARLTVSSDSLPRHTSISPQGSFGDLAVTSGDSASPSSQKQAGPADRDGRQSMDADSTQIVHMALNLSESRRLASRRNVSRSTPPRLAPIPGSSTGNELRQQLRQQRRSSRNESPRPTKIPSPRIPSGRFATSSLQHAFDTPVDGSYLYHFSPSTLARAQKAKDQLELMSQYRRLLEEVPPLKPRYARPVTSSPPGSPLGASKVFTWSSSNPAPLGRKYNPLQYIRNRKVRARERKTIDGDKQGFGDVESVRAWVDKIHRNTSLATGVPDAENAMPVFPGAEEDAGSASRDGSVRSAPRSRRARVDWFIEPCDMIADAYWLEQDNNKELIEDRNWRKVFPVYTDLSRPMSRQTEDGTNGIAPFSPWTHESAPGTADSRHVKSPHELPHNTIMMERAKDKLMQPWHSHHHDHGYPKPHSKKDSASERSESDKEAHRTVRDSHRRTDTSVSKTNDVLQKQMLEMIAKEAQEKDLTDSSIDLGNFVPPSMVTPEKTSSSKPGSRFQSRRASLVDTSDSDRRANADKFHTGSPPRQRTGRQSVDIPAHNRTASRDKDTSLPTSPELRPNKYNTEPVAEIPWSRSGSPTRNPIKKIRQIIHDKGADEESDADVDQTDGGQLNQKEDSQSPHIVLHTDGTQLSPRKSATAPPYDGYRGHRRTGSLRHRMEDQALGLRGMFKGPNHVIRGSVSKLGDILRKKDGSGESHEVDSTDESDSERARGRPRSSLTRARTGPTTGQDDSHKAQKHFLDTMPEFQHAPDAQRRSQADNRAKQSSSSPFGDDNSSSSRDRLLRPPHLAARSSPSSLSPQRQSKSPLDASDASESDSARGRVLQGVKDADQRLNSVLSDTFVDRSYRKSRQWSIVDDASRYPERTQLSRREIARMKTLVLSSGIKAMEINRRAHTSHRPFAQDDHTKHQLKQCGIVLPDLDISSDEMDREVDMCEIYPVTAQAISFAIQGSAQRWQSSADKFTTVTSPELHRRIGGVRSRVADDLSKMARKVMDHADETSTGLALDQPLKVKHVVDIIEKMIRRRRRRLRWVRRGLWLTVEWLLVGFMWYVWFVVTILRIFLGVGKGVWSGVKWLLWL